MKLIHCADLHIDSPMESNLPPEKARERKNEILADFARLLRLADRGNVSAILISGDLFDRRNITKKAERYVMDLIRSHPNLYFFYLAGNHDRGVSWQTLGEGEERPENLCLFGDTWRSYTFGDVVITGSEHPVPQNLSLKEDDLNIVLMHGQEAGGNGASEGDTIHFSKYQNKNIDYIALGHIHSYRTAQIDSRCLACYSGCLEGRGFDETGDKGYVLLETEGRKIKHTFVPFARRQLYAVGCDVTGFSTQAELEERMLCAVKDLSAESLVKLILTGSVPAEQIMDTEHLAAVLSGKFYFAKIENRTRLLIRPEDYRNDISLKGEFVRRVFASDLSPEEKERVLICGLRALCAEEVGL